MLRSSAALALALALGTAACDEDSTGPSGGSCTASTPITLGNPVNGALSISDCLNDDGWYEDKWILTLAEETIIQVDMASLAFDTFLIIRNVGGTELHADDDGAPGEDNTDSRLIVVLPAGTYTIVATSYNSGRTGSYQLAVAATE
jgi:hypothetical protein